MTDRTNITFLKELAYRIKALLTIPEITADTGVSSLSGYVMRAATEKNDQLIEKYGISEDRIQNIIEKLKEEEEKK